MARKRKSPFVAVAVFLILFACAGLVAAGLFLMKANPRQSELEKELSSLNDQVDNQSTLIPQLESELSELKKEHSSLGAQVSRNQADIQKTESREKWLASAIESREGLLSRLQNSSK